MSDNLRNDAITDQNVNVAYNDALKRQDPIPDTNKTYKENNDFKSVRHTFIGRLEDRFKYYLDRYVYTYRKYLDEKTRPGSSPSSSQESLVSDLNSKLMEIVNQIKINNDAVKSKVSNLGSENTNTDDQIRENTAINDFVVTAIDEQQDSLTSNSERIKAGLELNRYVTKKFWWYLFITILSMVILMYLYAGIEQI